MAAFIKFDGVDGESKDKDHKTWIDVLSLDWGIHKPGGGATGQTRRRGTAVLDDIMMTMEYEKSSPKLSEACCLGKVFPKVEAHLTATYGDGGRVTYLKYELKNVSVTSFQSSAVGNDERVPTVSMSLNFEELKQTYVEYDSAGKKKGNVEMSWKVEEGEK